MKDPDTLNDAIGDAVAKDSPAGLDDAETQLIREHRNEAIYNLCGKWFKYGEYLMVEIDTEKQTCVVVPVK